MSHTASPVARLARISRGLSISVAALLALLFVALMLAAAGLDVWVWIPLVGILLAPVLAVLALVLGLAGLARHEGRPATIAAFIGAMALAVSAIVFLWSFSSGSL